MGNETVQTKKPSLFGMIFSPGEQFERLRERPVIWVPLILFTLITTILAVVVVLNMDYTMTPGLEESSPEELEMIKIFGAVGGGIAGLFSVPIGYLFYSAIYFLAAKMVKSNVRFKQMFSLIIFVSFITILGSIINQLLALVLGEDPAIMFTSLNSFIGATGPVGAILNSIEVFSIWYQVLLAIGLIKVAKLSKQSAITIVIVLFVIGILITAGITAGSSALERLTQV